MKEGDKLGRFELLRRLGHGAVGAVFLARDTLLEAEVCLKLVHNALASNPEILARFSREVLLSRRVTHPNVCRIFDLHQEDEVRFVTMEYIEGRSLADVLYDRGPMPVADAVRVAERLCRALAVAHAEGIVHRDLKPGNIMMRGPDDPVILDFGIATALDVSRLTRPGVPLGTTHYIAPEVWSGSGAQPRSDIYAVGVILFNMLTAQTPFKPREPLMLLEAIEKGLPKPPSAINPEVPAALDALVRRCMSFDPKDRPDAAGLADELDLFLQLPPAPASNEDPLAIDDAVTKPSPSAEVTVRARPDGAAVATRTSEVPLPWEQDDATLPPQGALDTEITDEDTQPPREISGTFNEASWVVEGEAKTRLNVLALEEAHDDDLRPTVVDLRVSPDSATQPVYRPPKRSNRAALLLIGLGLLALGAWAALQITAPDDATAEPEPEPPVATLPTPEPEPVEPEPIEPEPVEPEPVPVEPEPEPVPVEPEPQVQPQTEPEPPPRSRRVRRVTRRGPSAAEREERAFKSARDALRALESSRGLRRGDDGALDELVGRMNRAARKKQFDEAREHAEAARAVAKNIAIDRAFVNGKLKRFNRRFALVQDEEAKKRVNDLLGVVVGHVAAQRYDRANTTLNQAFAELR